MSCPVPYTCPMIDEVIEKINDSLEVIIRFYNDEDVTIASLRDVAGELSDLEAKMEEIRRANSDIREWGEAEEIDKDDIQSEYDSLQERIQELETLNNDLNQQISELENA